MFFTAKTQEAWSLSLKLIGGRITRLERKVNETHEYIRAQTHKLDMRLDELEGKKGTNNKPSKPEGEENAKE